MGKCSIYFLQSLYFSQFNSRHVYNIYSIPQRGVATTDDMYNFCVSLIVIKFSGEKCIGMGEVLYFES